MSVSYAIHFTSATPAQTGTGSQITSDLSVDGGGDIKWTNATNGAQETVDYIEFTYDGTTTTAIVLEMSCNAGAYIGLLEYDNLNEAARATQGGISWTNNGSVLSVTITPPNPPPAPLPTSCDDYPKVYWKDTSGAPPTKLDVKIKRQKDSANPC